MAICPHSFALSPKNQMQDGIVVPCGKCPVCRLNQRRQKTARMLLESLSHKQTAMVTLTYTDWDAPMDRHGQQVLEKSDVQKYIKRLRYYREGELNKYAWCGEYGRRFSKRPHYHVITFGLFEEELMKKTWPYGDVDVQLCNAAGYAYVAGYVMKKSAKASDEDLMDRPDEFFHWSHRMGADAVPWLVSAHFPHREKRPFPKTFRMYGRNWPLDKYMQRMVEIEFAKQNDGELIEWQQTESDFETATKRSLVLKRRLEDTTQRGTF